MSEHFKGSTEAKESRLPHQRRLPPWVFGLMIGEMFFGLAWIGTYIFRKTGPLPEWFSDLEVSEMVRIGCVALAQPIPFGGWSLIWGDNGPPFQWIESTVFNVGFGLLLYGLIGALIGRWIDKRRNEPLR